MPLSSSSLRTEANPVEKWQRKPKNTFKRAPFSILNEQNLCASYKKTFSRMGLLKNGYGNKRCKDSLYIYNTCGPDSLIQCLTCLYLDNIDFQLKIDQIIDTSNFASLIASFAEKGVCERVYNLRTQVLSEIYKFNVIKGVTTINCDANITFLLKKLVSTIFPSMVEETNCSCSENNNYKYPLVPVNSNYFQSDGITCLQDAINTTVYKDFQNREISCKMCKKKCVARYELSNIIFIDVQYVDSNKEWNNELIARHSIPSKITIKNQSYSLKSTIDYILIHKSGHYVANCIRPDKNWYLYDDAKKNVYRSTTYCTPQLLILEKEF